MMTVVNRESVIRRRDKLNKDNKKVNKHVQKGLVKLLLTKIILLVVQCLLYSWYYCQYNIPGNHSWFCFLNFISLYRYMCMPNGIFIPKWMTVLLLLVYFLSFAFIFNAY